MEKDDAHEAPHVILEIWIKEWHTPSVFGRWKSTQHKYFSPLGYKWFKRMSLYLVVHCGFGDAEVQR